MDVHSLKEKVEKNNEIELLRYLYTSVGLKFMIGRDREMYTLYNFSNDVMNKAIPPASRVRTVDLLRVIVFNHMSIYNNMSLSSSFCTNNSSVIGTTMILLEDGTVVHLKTKKPIFAEQMLLYGVLNFDWPEDVLSNQTISWLYKVEQNVDIDVSNRMTYNINKNMIVSLLYVSCACRLQQLYQAGISDPEEIFRHHENDLWNSFETKKRKHEKT